MVSASSFLIGVPWESQHSSTARPRATETMKTVSAFSIFLSLQFIGLLSASCRILYLRLGDDGCPFARKGVPVANSCSYPDVVKAMYHGDHPVKIGLHHKLYQLADGLVLLTDSIPAAVDQPGVWAPVPPTALLEYAPFDGSISARFKQIVPLPITENHRRVGLININDKTCYANAFIQCLHHNPRFTFILEQAVRQKGLNPAHSIAAAMWDIMRIMKTMHGEERPSENQMAGFINLMNRDLGIELKQEELFIQSDSSEVLSKLLEQLNLDLALGRNPILGTSGILGDLFGIESQLKITNHRDDSRSSTTLESTMMMLVSPSAEVVEFNSNVDVDQLFGDLQFQREALKNPDLYDISKETATKRIAELEAQIPVFDGIRLTDLIPTLIQEDQTLDGLELVTSTKRSYQKLPPYLFLGLDRSGYGRRILNPLEFPLR